MKEEAGEVMEERGVGFGGMIEASEDEWRGSRKFKGNVFERGA